MQIVLENHIQLGNCKIYEKNMSSYEERVCNVEHGNFTPSVFFSVSMGPIATTFYFDIYIYIYISNQKQPSCKKKSAALEKAIMKKDVKSKVAAKKWL